MQNPSLPHPETKQKGYTIIELGIALAIVAVLIVAGLAGVTTVLNNSKSNGQIEESGIVLAKLQSLLTSTSASGINTAGAVGAGFFPAARVSGTTTNATVANKFGGSEFVGSNADLAASTGVTAGPGVGAIYTITSVPKAVCANIATSLATLANSAWIYSTTTAVTEATSISGTSNFTSGTSQIKAPGAQVQGARVGTQCNSGTTDTVNLAFFLRP
jgi:prepilin-type N-terminal cleavage/methylation domain-containing protein